MKKTKEELQLEKINKDLNDTMIRVRNRIAKKGCAICGGEITEDDSFGFGYNAYPLNKGDNDNCCGKCEPIARKARHEMWRLEKEEQLASDAIGELTDEEFDDVLETTRMRDELEERLK